MPSKEYEALVEKVAEIAEKYGDFADSHDAEECASEIIATFRAALQEPTEAMKEAWMLDMDRWISEEIEDEFHPWRVMLAASALGEQSE